MPRVLVVDDDARMVRLLTMTLPSSYEVTQASDGITAVSVAEKIVPDLMLLDVNMPGLNGFEVLRKVKSSPKLKGTKVIVVTARSDDADHKLALHLGADVFMTKPFSPMALLDRVSKLLGDV